MTHDQLEKLANRYGAFFDDEGVDTWNFDLWELHALLIAAFEQMKEKPDVKIKWSHSSLKQFETCQRQYHEIKVLKKWPFEQHESALYGEQLHLAAELYVKDGTPIPPAFAFIKPMVDALLTKKGVKYPEHEMALDEQLNVVAWDSPDVWVRGIADLLIIDEEEGIAWCIDYKTGSDRYPDTNQLDLMSLMVFKHFPQIHEVRSALLFVVKNSMTKHKVTREQEEALWWKYRERVASIAGCMDTGVWRPKQSGLCKSIALCSRASTMGEANDSEERQA